MYKTNFLANILLLPEQVTLVKMEMRLSCSELYTVAIKFTFIILSRLIQSDHLPAKKTKHESAFFIILFSS